MINTPMKSVEIYKTNRGMAMDILFDDSVTTKDLMDYLAVIISKMETDNTNTLCGLFQESVDPD